MYVRRDGCSSVDPIVQRLQPGLKVRLVVLPGHAIHAGGGFAFERIERQPERIDIDVVEERGEPLVLPKLCCLPYAVQRLGHASPGLRPVRALMIRVPLGIEPWLHRRRRRLPSIVQQLHSYYARVRLHLVVRRRLQLLAFPPRTNCSKKLLADQKISRFPYKERPYMPRSQTTPDRPGACDGAPVRIAFRSSNGVGILNLKAIAAQCSAYTLPCRRFADILADA
jgi:hypothetical protein